MPDSSEIQDRFLDAFDSLIEAAHLRPPVCIDIGNGLVMAWHRRVFIRFVSGGECLSGIFAWQRAKHREGKICELYSASDDMSYVAREVAALVDEHQPA